MKSKFRLFLYSLIFCFASAAYAGNENIKIVSRFWEYETIKLKKAIETRLESEYTTEELSKFSERERKAYLMMLSGSCSTNHINNFKEIHEYRCQDKSLNKIFQLSLEEPMVLLFVKQEDADIVAGYL